MPKVNERAQASVLQPHYHSPHHSVIFQGGQNGVMPSAKRPRLPPVRYSGESAAHRLLATNITSLLLQNVHPLIALGLLVCFELDNRRSAAEIEFHVGSRR
jgi:hypothetical protein